MAYEKRGRQSYYYQAIRVHGRPHRIYLGRGPEAEQAAAAVAQRRQQRAAERSQVQADLFLVASALQPFLDFADQADLLFRATLEAHGYHQPCRGPWRKRQHPNSRWS